MTTTPARTSDHRTPWRRLVRRLRQLAADDSGMSTVEYAIGTIAAAAFAAILYAVVSGDSIVGALTTLIQRALTATF
jgi:fatty acid desaturase